MKYSKMYLTKEIKQLEPILNLTKQESRQDCWSDSRVKKPSKLCTHCKDQTASGIIL